MQGAQVYENSSAIKMTENAHGWTIRTAKGVVRAAKLIQVTNVYGTAAADDNSITPAHYFQLYMPHLERFLANARRQRDCFTKLAPA